MKQKIGPIDTGKIKTYSLKERESKVSREHFGRAVLPGAQFSDFLRSLPDILAGSDLRDIVKRVAEAVRNGRPV